MKHPHKIYSQGTIVKYEPTEAGRKKVADLVEKFPSSCAPVNKVPHHVELLTDFAFHPIIPESASSLVTFPTKP